MKRIETNSYDRGIINVAEFIIGKGYLEKLLKKKEEKPNGYIPPTEYELLCGLEKLIAQDRTVRQQERPELQLRIRALHYLTEEEILTIENKRYYLA